ncbi:TPA: hypothetical protein ACH3X2_002524 [Trebouxia sp. C0005]
MHPSRNHLQVKTNSSGTWGTRTRAITANNAGKLKWVERLILELKDPVGKQLAVQLVLDTERPNMHGWSLWASDGDHNNHLDTMDIWEEEVKILDLPSTSSDLRVFLCLCI